MYGSHVAYKIRFDGNATSATRIIFLTEGLLLRQMQMDVTLKQYDVIILDEVHERHLQSDLLLGLIADIILKRDDLRLVLMSATINLDLFTKYFEGIYTHHLTHARCLCSSLRLSNNTGTGTSLSHPAAVPTAGK